MTRTVNQSDIRRQIAAGACAVLLSITCVLGAVAPGVVQPAAATAAHEVPVRA